MNFISHRLSFAPIAALVVLAFLFFWNAPLPADPPEATLDAANRAYTDGHYEESAKLFQQLITANGYSAELCFDLANAEARAGHVGLAMLNYERARYLAPADPDINHNLQVARKQAGLQPNGYRWWEVALRSIYPVAGYLVLACMALLLLALIGQLAVSGNKNTPPFLRTVLKLIFFVGIPVTLLLCFVEVSAVGFNFRIEGVIVAPKQATLRQSPFESADSLGTIPEGEKVTVEESSKGYFYVEGRDKNHGWVQAKEIEPVIAGSFDSKTN
jgi:hypothetical protein